MSNALAIAHVSQALALLIESHLQPEIDMAVKVEPRKPPAEPPTDPTISVFLYQVTPNTSQRNNDLPTRASDGTLVRRASAALDLQYVISAYGDETELVGQRLIGSVVRTLHEIPVLPKDVIELAGERPYLAGSNLAEAAQRVRFTPMVMDVDETSKLWGMLYQTPYALSVVYQASLVFIDGRETPVPAKPVERPEVRVLPFGAPGAPVPPGAEPRPDETQGDTAGRDGAKTQPAGEPASGKAGERDPGKAEEPASGKAPRTPPAKVVTKAVTKAVAKAVTKTADKAVAKTADKAPARARKAAQPARTARRTPKSARPAGDPDSASGPRTGADDGAEK
ncbi:Pvc16 family protein [Streptomyces sp. NPDC020362]|uniref:Pvc16 family protein n=1 Tax=unclassified Streptomyces TaxID=2593676 RepID=UPI000B298C6B